MSTIFWNELKAELRKGPSEKGHPFRHGTLATVGLEDLPRLRTVVLREVGKDLTLTFYTDRRSKKITHIKENNKVSLLFYDSGNLLQLKIEGIARMITDKAILDEFWNGIAENSKKDYTTTVSPGSNINNPDTIEYLEDENYFCIVEVEPFKIEYLKLRRPNHLRVRFSKNETEWTGEFLVP